MTKAPTPEWVIEQLCKVAADVDINGMVESGRLVPRKSGWYEVKDAAALKELGQLVTAFTSDSPPRVRISRTAARQARQTLTKVRTDLLRDAAARCDQDGREAAAALCREILRERGVAGY